MADGNDNEREDEDPRVGDDHGEDETGEGGDSHGGDGHQRLPVLIRQAAVIWV